MSLTVVTGLPGSGAVERVLTEMKRVAREGRPALLVMPSATGVETARAALARDVTLGVRVATLDGALQREWALHGDGRGLVAAAQRDILAARALVAADVSTDPGRGAALMLAALAQRHAAAGTRSPEARPGLAGRLIDAVREYETDLERRGLIEPAEAARMVAAFPAPAEAVGVVGFANLRPEQEYVITSWASSADVWIELPWAEGNAATEGLSPLVGRLVEHGGILERLPARTMRPAELQRVTKSLFAGGSPSPAEGAVRLGVGRGDEGEAELIASMAAELVAAGESPGEIVIAFPDPARHLGWVAHELRAAGLSVSVDIASPAAQTPFGRALAALWAAAHEPATGQAAVAFLRTSGSGADVADADRVDLFVRQGRMREASSAVARLQRSRRLLETCARLSRAPIDRESAATWKEMADSLLANAYPGDAPVARDDASRDAAAHRAFCRVLDELLALGEGDVGADQLIQAFRFASVRPRTVPRMSEGAEKRGGAVLVTSLQGLREARPRNGIVGGLTAGEVPGRGAAERLEGGAVRGALAALGVEIGPDEQGAAERLAFYLAVTAPTRTLALTRRESDDEGRALRPSVFWEEFLDLYRTPEDEASAGAPLVSHSSVVETRRVGVVRERGLLADPEAIGELMRIGAVSPSQIELYLRCPYRWFVERRLRPDSPDVVFDAREAGSLAHAALFRFYQRLPELGPRVTAANLQGALRLAADSVAEITGRAPRVEGVVAARMLADVGPAVERTVAADAGFLPDFVPVLHEWSFGLGDADEAVDLDGLVLAGRADRVDVGPDGLVVVDYKLSKVTPVAKFEDEGRVQLQLYAAAASRKLGVPVAGGLYRSLRSGKSRGFVLDGVQGAFTSTDRRDRAGIDELVEAAVRAGREAVAGMRAGLIEPTPSKERCANCCAAAFCPDAVG